MGGRCCVTASRDHTVRGELSTPPGGPSTPGGRQCRAMEAEPLPEPDLGDGAHEPAGEPGAAQPGDAGEAAGDVAAGDAAAAGEHETEIDIGPLDFLCVGPIV